MELFDANGAEELLEDLSKSVDAAYVVGRISTLGGAHRPTILLTVGLDERHTWANGIFENSRYFKLAIDHWGNMELINDSGRKGHAGMMEKVALVKRWRKTKAKSFADAVAKVNKYVNEVYYG